MIVVTPHRVATSHFLFLGCWIKNSNAGSCRQVQQQQQQQQQQQEEEEEEEEQQGEKKNKKKKKNNKEKKNKDITRRTITSEKQLLELQTTSIRN